MAEVAVPPGIFTRFARWLDFRPLPVVLALLTVLVGAGLLEFSLVRNPLRGTALRTFLADSLDESTSAMHAAVNSVDNGVPVVAVLGGSAMRDAVLPAEEFEARVRSLSDVPVRYLRLAVSGQSMSESIAMATSVRAAPGSIFLVHTSPFRFPVTRADAESEVARPRLPLIDYSIVASTLTDSGSWVRPPMLAYSRLWLSYVVRERLRAGFGACAAAIRHLRWPAACKQVPNLARVWTPPSTLRVSPERPGILSRETKARLSGLYRLQLLAERPEDYRLSEQMWSRFLKVAQARGWRVIFLELPFDSIAQGADAVREPEMRAALAHLRNEGAEFVDWHTMHFDSSQFFDLQHFLPPGRAIFSDTLAHWVAKEIRPSNVRHGL